MQEDENDFASLIDTATDADLLDESVPSMPPDPEDDIRREAEDLDFAEQVFSINEFPAYLPEEQNPNILIKGRWLERGGSAWWISTAGTGKSIASVQAAYCWGAGLPFAGLEPHRPIRSWIIQSEDSPSRITIDREDITAELREKYPDVKWRSIAKDKVIFVKPKGGISGVDFFVRIGALLEKAKRDHKLPDVIIINPFLAFVGGPVSDGGYVTPFLRGGDINGKPCEGLQPFLERFNIAALIYHHTPKPPTEKEIESWLKSMFPEYQGAGSSDITNWGRSFVTMMKVPNHTNMVCMCAGKNGGELGWERIGGLTRRYMAWSNGVSITGGSRHAWRELTDDERDEIVVKQLNDAERNAQEVANKMADDLKRNGACRVNDFEIRFKGVFPRAIIRSAKTILMNNLRSYRLTVRDILIGKKWTKFVGLVGSIEAVSEAEKQRHRVSETFDLNTKEAIIARQLGTANTTNGPTGSTFGENHKQNEEISHETTFEF